MAMTEMEAGYKGQTLAEKGFVWEREAAASGKRLGMQLPGGTDGAASEAH